LPALIPFLNQGAIFVGSAARRMKLCHNVFAVSRSPEQSVRGNVMSEAIS